MNRFFRYVFISAISIVMLSFLLCSLAKLPSPQNLLALALELSPPSGSYRYFDAVSLSRSSQPLHFETAPAAIASRVHWHDGTFISFDELQQKTHTNALLILHQNKLVYERYYHDAGRDTAFPSFSLAKSFISALIGVALKEGSIKSLDDPISTYIPALAGAAPYTKISVDQLLNMRSGIAVSERYDSPFSKIAYMYVTTDLNRFVAELPQTPIISGNQFNYRSVDYLLLAMVLKGATGRTPSSYLNEKIWQPMGAEYAATWSVDGAKNKAEKGFCCLNAKAIDFVKFGALYLNQGTLNGNVILPAAWSRRQQQLSGSDRNFAYGNGWWLPKARSGAGDFMAIGIHGQFIYVNPATQTVIVKLSDHGEEEDEALTVEAFQNVAAELARTLH